MRLPDEVRKCVTFIGKPGAGDRLILTGTAFFVSVDGPQLPGQCAHFVYLVTARHCVDKLPPGRFGIRVRMKNGETRVMWSGENARWYFHPTEPDATDIAVTPWELDLKEMDIKLASAANILTDETIEQRSIGTGDEVYITGLFTRLQDEPIVRTGNIAAMPKGLHFPGSSLKA